MEILSLGRNQIKKLEGLDNVADTLRELWISYNQIDKLNGIEKLKNLQVWPRPRLAALFVSERGVVAAGGWLRCRCCTCRITL